MENMDNINKLTWIPCIAKEESNRLYKNDINMIHCKNRIIIFEMTNGDIIRMTGEYKDIEEYLDSSFCRVMKNHIVNFDNVQKMKACKIIFRNNQVFSMGKNYFGRARAKFNRYLKVCAAQTLGK